MRRKSRITFELFCGIFSALLASAPAQAGTSKCPSLVGSDHPAADAVRELASVLYEPFASYHFNPGGNCIDPGLFQVLTNVYLRTSDGYSPTIESLCLDRPQDGDLSIRWVLGPTPEGKLFVIAGEDPDEVESHDFWRILAPQSLVCSDKIDISELVFEREGGIDVHVDLHQGTSASVKIYGVSVSASIPGSGLPAFLTGDVGIDELAVNDQNVFTADLSAPLFDIPISASGDVGPGDPLTLDVLGIHFRIH